MRMSEYYLQQNSRMYFLFMVVNYLFFYEDLEATTKHRYIQNTTISYSAIFCSGNSFRLLLYPTMSCKKKRSKKMMFS